MKRTSFASIEQKIHQDINKKDFNFENIKLDSTENIKLVSEILDLFSELSINKYDGNGEWEWLQKNKQNNFINALLDRKIEVVSQFLTNMFKTEATYGYLSPSFSDALFEPEKVKSDVLCNIDSCIEFSDIVDINSLASIYGNPYGLKVGNYAVLPDSPRHYYYSYNISRLLKNKVSSYLVEIGGGYGGLCFHNWKRFKGNCTLINIDLLPALVTAYFYLTKNGIPVNVITPSNNTVKENEVNLISANNITDLLKIIPKSDLIFNSRSLCEMSADAVLTYFNFINSCDVKFFYHENSNYLLFPNSDRHIELIGDQFPIDSKKFELKSKYLTPFTGGSGRYREYIYETF